MKSTLTILAIVLSSMATFGQSAKHATARVFEMQNAKLSRIVLVYEDGQSEVIPLQALKLFGANDQVLIDNQKAVNDMINGMAEKGYRVESMSTSGDQFLYSLILFKKE